MNRATTRTLSFIRQFHTSVPKMSASASVANPSTLATPLNKTAHAFDKGQLDAMLSRRFFYAPAFEIYGGELDLIVHG
jgi:glycyl-tRNA synthetase